MEQKLIYLVVAATAILHDGKRYEKGDRIELTETEAENLSLYVALDESEAERQKAEAEAEAERQKAEAEAEKQRLAAEKAAQEAAKKRNQANKGKVEQ